MGEITLTRPLHTIEGWLAGHLYQTHWAPCTANCKLQTANCKLRTMTYRRCTPLPDRSSKPAAWLPPVRYSLSAAVVAYYLCFGPEAGLYIRFRGAGHAGRCSSICLHPWAARMFVAAGNVLSRRVTVEGGYWFATHLDTERVLSRLQRTTYVGGCGLFGYS